MVKNSAQAIILYLGGRPIPLRPPIDKNLEFWKLNQILEFEWHSIFIKPEEVHLRLNLLHY